MSGCLPVVLQLPILVAFYNVLRFAVELRHAPFALWIRDLSAVDHTYVLLILMIVSMYVQQAMTPTTADPTQPGHMKLKVNYCRAPDGVRLAYAMMGGGLPLVKTANWMNHLEFDWENP